MRGFAVLPMVLGLSFIVAVVAAALAFVGTAELTQSTKQRDGNLAFFAAQAGIDDAKIRIARNLNYENLTGWAVTVPKSDGSILGTATVTVDKDHDCAAAVTPGTTTKDCVVSTGTVKSSKRKIQAVFTIVLSGAGSNIGKATMDSFTELAP